ncbi:phytanoyl-CoA dioxygenase family protein [Vibrio lentus]
MLTQEQINFYNDNGYLVVNDLFGCEELKVGINAIEEVLENNSACEFEPEDKTTVRRIWAPTKQHSYFWELATKEKLLDSIQCLLGESFLFHYSKLNMKGPKVGSVVEWHQDFSYYPHTNSALLTVLIPFDDMTRDNGPLKVVPGSHKNGLDDHYIDGYFRGKLSNVNDKDSVTLDVPAGGAIFLHCLTKHASEKNESEHSRRTFLPAYRAADALPIYFGPHAAHNEPGATLVRGVKSKVARVESANCYLPLAKKEFGSIYEVQEGSHLNKSVSDMKKSGYAVD